MSKTRTVVIIGGGIAGTSCAEYILENDKVNEVKVIIITPKDVVKTAVTKKELTRTLKEIGILETEADKYEATDARLSVKVGFVIKIDTTASEVILKSGEKINYDKICVCTGATPNVIGNNNPFVLSLRDTDNAKDLQKKLSVAKKIIVIGNGGIALELVYEIFGCEIIWCIKDESIGNTFFDEAAAKFLVPTLDTDFKLSSESGKHNQIIFKRRKHEAQKKLLLNDSDSKSQRGSALGPDWSSQQKLEGSLKYSKRKVEIEYSCSIIDVWSGEESDSENVYAKLSNGKIIGADFIVSATGVSPHVPFEVSGLELSSDGGINVDCQMKTNLLNIYAAGDACTPVWDQSETWFPMKLWTQAWQMGLYAGKCILNNLSGEDVSLDMCFELFSHITTFFGYKVCLLGCFNGQKLNESEYEVLLRITKDVEYVKVILKNGRMKGCLLIGETDLEETFENLILNELDIGFLGDSLLDPGVDIEDYFD